MAKSPLERIFLKTTFYVSAVLLKISHAAFRPEIYGVPHRLANSREKLMSEPASATAAPRPSA